MPLLSCIVTEDFLVALRALLLEIQRLASAALDAGLEIMALVFGS
jgi:hypothetical protein